MLDRITRLALQTLDKLDSTGQASRWLLSWAKRAQPVKTAGSYNLDQLRQRIDTPLQPSMAYCWSLQDIMATRDLQMAGKFCQPAEMSAAMNTDDAIFVARQARLAPIEAMAVAIEAASDKGKAKRVAGHAGALFGPGGSVLSKADEKALNRDLADHGFAIGCNSEWCVSPGGSGVYPVHRHWPIRDVEWDSNVERLVALVRVDADPPPTAAPATSRRYGRLITSVPIVHGDGRWVIYQSQAHHSWQHDAAILAGSLVWARHAFGAGDWAAVSQSHGSPKWLGTLKPNTPLQERVNPNDPDSDLKLTPEADAMLKLLGDLASLSHAYGIKENGAEAELIVNSSTAWQVFKELMMNAESAAARIWTGTDALLGSRGGAPGIDISALFGVASTIIQGDLGTITRAFHEGVIVPWTALNYGTSALAPRREYQIPDPDLQRAREQYAAQEEAFVAAIQGRRSAGLLVTQDWVNHLADRLGVVQGELAAAQATGIQLAPTDVFKLITANEGRGISGFEAREDGDIPATLFGQPETESAPAPVSRVQPVEGAA